MAQENITTEKRRLRLERDHAPAEASTCGLYQKDSGSGCQTGKSYPKWLLWLWNHPQLYMFLLECRSFVHRIRIVLTTPDSHEVCMGVLGVEGTPEHLSDLPNKCLHARTRDIETMFSTFAWATPLDWRVAALAWEQGARWSFDSMGYGTAFSSVQKAFSERQDTKPDSVVPQCSTRDRQSPLPSRE
jgi:hypothetical protein